MLLSSTAGSQPWLIGALLIFGNVGQTFMQIGLSNTISQSLPREQTGVGMGLMAMLNFFTFASISAILSKTLDQGAESSWNGLNHHDGAAVFSNIYLALAAVSLLLAAVYTYRMHRIKRNNRSVQELTFTEV